MADSPTDKVQIGLTAAADEAIREVAAHYFENSQQDAYRFAIVYAIAHDLDLASAPTGGYGTKFAALSGIESGNRIRDLLEILEVGDKARPFATAERLAEIGIRDIARRLSGNESMADLLTVGAPSPNE